MSRTHLAKIIFLAALLIVGSEAKPVRGRKRSFGMGLLGGALAGAVVGNAVAKASGASKTSAPAAAPVAQVVETGMLDANGCYRQTIKEPVAGNSKLYTETVHLVCPNGQAAGYPAQVAAPAPAAAYTVVAAPVAPAASAAASAAPSNQTQAISSTHSNATHTQTIVVNTNPSSVPAPVPAPVPVPVPVPVPAASPAPHSGLTIVYASAPNTQHVPQLPQRPQPGTAHVILLSKTVKKQKSAAPTLNVSHGLLILVVLYCLISK